MSQRINNKSVAFYKLVLLFLRKPHTNNQCADHFGLTPHHMRYHLTNLHNSGCVDYSGQYDARSVLHVTVKNDYVHVETGPIEYKDKEVKRVVQVSPFITQYNLMTNDHVRSEPKKSPRVYVGSTMGMI